MADSTAPAHNTKNRPRDLAVRVLTRVLSDREPLDEAIAAVAAGLTLTPENRAWLQDVCSGTLRWKGRIDAILDSIALKKKPTGWLRKVLSIAVYQLLAQERTHPGLVVSETVDEVQKKEGKAPASFSNALLRKVSDHRESWRAFPFPEKGKALEQAQWASLPEWLWRRLVSERGVEWARAYAEASLERPTLWVRAKDSALSGSGAELFEAGPLPGAYRFSKEVSGAITERAGFHEGRFFVQDVSSQFLIQEITLELRKVMGSGPLSVLDLCAAPGGKSVGLAWSGFTVTATDRDPSRLVLLKETVARVAPQVQVILREAVEALPLQHCVWVDAPCSGTGILRRHPDVRWLRGEKELAGLIKVQSQLLTEAWEKTLPGGMLAYSVCSVLREEGSAAIELFCSQNKAKIVREWLLCPQESPGGDGFWAALIRKS